MPERSTFNYEDWKCKWSEKSSVSIEICKEKTSNNCPLRNGSSFKLFLKKTKIATGRSQNRTQYGDIHHFVTSKNMHLL